MPGGLREGMRDEVPCILETITEADIFYMLIDQSKNKVRPVLNYRELNKSVECHTGDDITDVCSEKLRSWRKVRDKELVDFKSAYLQLRVSKDL